MRKAKVENSSLECTWEFGQMLLLLPDSGTTEFATLFRALRPYGVSASDILYDKPSDRLADDYLRISFHDGDMVLSLSYDDFTISANDLSLKDEGELVNIVQALFEALDKVGAEPSPGEAFVEWTADLIFPDSEVEIFLRDHSSERQTEAGLVFDGAAYIVKQSSLPGSHDPRISFGRSWEAPNALTVQFTATYGATLKPSKVLKLMTKDRERALALVQLKTLTTRKES